MARFPASTAVRTRLVLAAAAVVATALPLAAQADGGAKKPGAAQRASASALAWVDAPAKPNGSGIRLRYHVPAAVQPGQRVTVQLEFSNVKDGAEAQWRLPEGVATPLPGQAAAIQLVPGQPNVVSLDVVPAADGMVYLDVVTRQGGRGSVQSVPLKVGSGKPLLKREGTLETTPSGEKIISLPSTPR